MKKFVMALSLIILVIFCTTSVAAASAYSTIKLTGDNPDITLIDSDDEQWYNLPLNWWGPDGQWDGESALTADHTPGCAFQGDIVRIANVDFGANGPASVTLNFSQNDGDETNAAIGARMGIFVDGVMIAELFCGFTGDWGVGMDNTAAITADITGVKTVDIKYMEDTVTSGTPFSLSFTEKAPAPAAVVEEAAPVVEEPVAQAEVTAAPVAPAAPKVGDNAVLFISIMLAVSVAGVVTLKRKANKI